MPIPSRSYAETTAWHNYGTESGNPKCANCMVHSGYEASAVNDTFGSVGGMVRTVRSMLFNKHRDAEALNMLNEQTASGPQLQSAGAHWEQSVKRYEPPKPQHRRFSYQ